MADWIISQFPQHKIYVEAFGGAASVLLKKPRARGEIYNDLDGEVVNLFRMLRQFPEELLRLIELSPSAREDFEEAFLRGHL